MKSQVSILLPCDVELMLIAGEAIDSVAASINNAWQIVGTSSGPQYGDQSRAFIYENGRFVDLNTLVDPFTNYPWIGFGNGNILNSAIAINNSGDILALAGYGFPNSSLGGENGFLLTPYDSTAAPEPSPFLCLGIGILLALRRKKR